ncbi:hypothetical protein JYU29_17160 [Tianweitania sp. BSSL-BM11]|uniref:Uncharacterized protein n=1 Tax=Tianweitania aestuarii TaxID=2814886 RepID=A0ABS5RZG0_9HYPH|nr:hypothetical protein [Tianweitania aestuarii]MBS9722425.1 hypothetical protein [Tianweitania aestuarii]
MACPQTNQGARTSMEEDIEDRSEERHRAYEREAIKVLRQAHDHFRDTLDATMFQDALRFALDADNAISRCSRRDCRMAKACQTRVRDGEPLDCGAGIPEETLVLAAKLAIFGHMAWFKRWWHGIMNRGQKSDRS